MDEIIIKGLRVKGKHGCFARERNELNDFEVSARLFLNLERACVTDELSDTIDYPAAMSIMEGVFAGESVRLIEKLADSIAERMFVRFANLLKIEVEVRKIGVSVGFDFDSISAKITRERAFYLK